MANGARPKPVRRWDFNPPPSREERAVPLHQEPVDHIPLLGLMMHDAALVRDLVGALPSDANEYRSRLRVIRTHAQSIADRAKTLLGE